MNFQIFGSENSTDYDVMVFVDTIPTNIDDGHQRCKSFNEKLSTILIDKPLNSNFAIITDGEISYVFKGTIDEVNNALYNTYHLHKQYHPKQITKYTSRETYVKLLRVYRCVLSFYSRSSLRTVIKQALKSSDINIKYHALEQINIVNIKEFPNKKESIQDIYKIIAFQFGQLFSLIDGYESDSYTKNGIIKNYPDLEPMLNRKNLTDDNLLILDNYKKRLLSETLIYQN